MDGSGGWWIDVGLSAGKSLLAAIATVGSAAVLYIARKVRADSDTLDEVHQHYQRLKKIRIIARVMSNTRTIRELRKELKDSKAENKKLVTEIKIGTVALNQYEAACQSLSAAVELRAREHHEFRTLLQTYSTRTTIIETKLNIKDQWRHDSE